MSVKVYLDGELVTTADEGTVSLWSKPTKNMGWLIWDETLQTWRQPQTQDEVNRLMESVSDGDHAKALAFIQTQAKLGNEFAKEILNAPENQEAILKIRAANPSFDTPAEEK